MRRARVAIVVALVAIGGATALAVRSHQKTDSMYEVDAVFDTGRGLLPGGRVKIAGANVGVIKDIKLTPGRKALVEMRVDKRFAPFRSDAHCSSRPQGLVGVADVNCQPGTPAGRPLAKGEFGHPTLPLGSTSVPVNITDFFEIWKVPVRDRLRVLLNELGMTLSGRGDQLNDLLLRANPSIVKARKVLAILVAQRREIARSITDSNRAIGELAADRGATRGFVDEGARTAQLVAEHERALGAGIAGLPPLLRRSQSALRQLDALNHGSLPLVRNLRAAAPALDRLAGDTVPFAKLALPSVRALEPAVKEGNATVKVLGPFVGGLEKFSKDAVPAGRLQSDLQVDLRDTGTYESLLKLFYVGAASVSRFDAIGHIDPSHVTVTSCAPYATKADDCEYHWVDQRQAQARRTRARHRTRRHRRRHAAAPTGAPGASPPSAPAPKVPGHLLPALPNVPGLPPVQPPPLPPAADQLLNYLLG